MVAAHTVLPVLGVPVQSQALSGLDSLLSIVQMPAGVPVATLAIGKAGATNAGLLAVELFVTTHGDLYINELAARPHNTFHATERACSSSQFEQHVRAVCDLPLADVSLLRPAAIVNLFGDLWLHGTAGGDRSVDLPALDLTQALSVPTLRLRK